MRPREYPILVNSEECLIEGTEHFMLNALKRDPHNKWKELLVEVLKAVKMERSLSIESYLYPPVYERKKYKRSSPLLLAWKRFLKISKIWLCRGKPITIIEDSCDTGSSYKISKKSHHWHTRAINWITTRYQIIKSSISEALTQKNEREREE